MLETAIKKIVELYKKRDTVDNLEKYIVDEIVEGQLLPELGYEKNIFKIIPVVEKKGYYIQNIENKSQKLALLIAEETITPKEETALLSLIEDDMEWGMITNGQNIILMNRNIQTNNIENWRRRKVVLDIKLSENRDIRYLKYFSKEELFQKKNILYFKDIVVYRNTQYRGKEESWAAYNSSLKRFFDAYITEYDGVYDGYEKFEFADFEHFISKSNVKSPATIVNIYAHISVYLQDKIGVRKNGFEQSRKQVLKLFEGVKKEELGDILDERRLREINKYFLKKKKFQLRNFAVFYLAVCYGIERRQICQLRWSNIAWNKMEITLEGKQKRLPEQLGRLLRMLEDENEKRGYPHEYIFYVYRQGELYPITKDAINTMFSSLSEINRSDNVYTQYSPAKIRRSLAKKLLETLPLEKVMWLLSIEPENLSKYLTSEEIYENAEKQEHKQVPDKNKWHPMANLLDEVF